MKTQPTWRVVHILSQGLALCGAGMPNSWPTAHRWVPLNEYPAEIGKHSFCPDCEDEYLKAQVATKPKESEYADESWEDDPARSQLFVQRDPPP